MPAYVVDRDRVTWRVVDDEAVVVHAETSDYFSLNASGTWLWTLLERPRTPETLAGALSARWERAAAETAADVAAFLSEVVGAGLLVAMDGPEVAVAADWTAPRDPYEPPQLVRFGNLETLILSGE